MDIASNGGANIVVSVEFEGEIATTLREDDALRAQLETVLRERVADVDVEQVGRRYVLRPTIDEVRRSAGLTGVGDVAVSVSGGMARVAIQTVSPDELSAAIESAVAGEPDAAELSATMRSNTFLEVRVNFPGEVISSNGGVIDDSSVRYRDPVGRWSDGVLSVSGETSRGSNIHLWLVGAGLASVGGLFFVRRRAR